MLLAARHRVNDICQLDLMLDGTTIEKVSKQKLLGIIFEENLSWPQQIDYLCSTLSTKISLLKQILTHLSQDLQHLSKLYRTVN